MSVATNPATAAVTTPEARRSKDPKESYRPNWTTTILLILASLTVLIPLYFAIAM